MENEPESFQHQALEIQQPGDDFDPSVEPKSGEEFLMHMLYERRKCPSIVVCRPKNLENTINSTVITEEKHTSSPTLLPTAEWKQAQEDMFQLKRERIEQMRSTLTANAYDNTLEPPLSTEAKHWLRFCQEQMPLLTTIMRISQRNLEALLELMCEWLNATDSDDENGDPSDDPLEKTSKLTVFSSSSSSAAAVTTADTQPALDLSSSEQWLGLWLYAVLACLHLPLEPNVHSTLREIARACLKQRARLQPQELGKAVPYNLFIHLIAKVFGQLDFAEYV